MNGLFILICICSNKTYTKETRDGSRNFNLWRQNFI